MLSVTEVCENMYVLLMRHGTCYSIFLKKYMKHLLHDTDSDTNMKFLYFDSASSELVKAHVYSKCFKIWKEKFLFIHAFSKNQILQNTYKWTPTKRKKKDIISDIV